MLRRNSSLNIPKFNLDITPKTSKIPSEVPITESDEFMREYAGKSGAEPGDTIEQFMADVNFSKDNAEKPKSNVVEEVREEVTAFPIDESNNEYDTTTIDETNLFRGTLNFFFYFHLYSFAKLKMAKIEAKKGDFSVVI